MKQRVHFSSRAQFLKSGLPVQTYRGCLLRTVTYLTVIIGGLLLPSSFLYAQDELLGLTSVGGADGVGTAFRIKSNGTNFNVQKTFAESGSSPRGDLLKGTDGNFYGMTASGGANDYGSIFKMAPNGNISILFSFSNSTGGSPQGNLIQGKDGNFYGMTTNYGRSGYGTIFKITPSGTFTILRNFNGTIDGRYPQGSLVQGTDNNLYGLTESGGTHGDGTVFKITLNGAFTVLHQLNSSTDGGAPKGELVQGNDGNFYGLTHSGGTNSYGTIFRITPGGTFTVSKHLAYKPDGGRSYGSLIKGNNGNFYGMTYQGGEYGYGTIFRMTPNGAFTVLRNLNYNTDGAYPQGNLVQGADNNFYGLTYQGGTNSYGTIFKLTPGGTYSVIRNLDNVNDTRNPTGSLVQGSPGIFYGVSSSGGPGSQGTIFKISTTGTYITLVHFPEANKGHSPEGSLIQASNGNFYGLTAEGGTYKHGTVFKLCDGVYSTIYSFNSSTSGRNPRGSLIQGTDGNFYGMTESGGAKGYGTIFKITLGGNLTVLHNLDYTNDGGSPKGSLIQGSNGNFYGMTYYGGANSHGTIFRITAGGIFTVLKHLERATTGAYPYGSLVQGNDGNFYGVTNQGGTNYGTIFKITPTGTFTVLRNLDNTNDGSYPYGTLLKGSDNNLYGLTTRGGVFNSGTVFRISPSGAFKMLYSFDDVNDGGQPKGSLIQAADGSYYGVTSEGGFYNNGTIFKFTSGGTYSVLRHLNQTTDGGKPLGNLVLRKPNPVANGQSVTTLEETAKPITLVATGGTSLIYTIIKAPTNGTLSGTGANRTYKPNANFAGNDSFTYQVTWGCQTSAIKTVSITVTNVNDAPVLAAIGDKNATVGTKLSFTASALDPDAGQTKTFSLIGAPAGASINAGSGVFNWTPAAEGSYFFKVKVTDNGTPPLFDEEIITITVSNSNVRLASQPLKATVPDKANRLVLYPNPVVQVLTIDLPEPVQTLSTIISNIDGKKMLIDQHQLINSNQVQVNVQNLPPGLYMFNLDLNRKKETLKFIKQ